MMINFKSGKSNNQINPGLESRLDALVAHLDDITLDEYTIIFNDLKIAAAMKSVCLAVYKNVSAKGAGE
jgi:hypothetical protein